MSAQIHHLEHVRLSGVICPDTGIKFPQVYRITGKVWEFSDGRTLDSCLLKSRDELRPSGTFAEPEYSLKFGHGYAGLAETTWTAIDRLDSQVDSSWVVVRHHDNRDVAEGYLDATCDYGPRSFSVTSAYLFETKLGLFSILKREAPPNRMKPLLMYVCKTSNHFGPLDWYHIIDSDGKVHDDGVLYGDEESDFMKPLMDIIDNISEE